MGLVGRASLNLLISLELLIAVIVLLLVLWLPNPLVDENCRGPKPTEPRTARVVKAGVLELLGWPFWSRWDDMMYCTKYKSCQRFFHEMKEIIRKNGTLGS